MGSRYLSHNPWAIMFPLVVEQLTKSYGHQVVLQDLSFTVHPGRVTGFLGPNGAGKSTTMKILLDLASAESGRARIGQSRFRDLDERARTVGVVLEPNAFHPGRIGRNHLKILAEGAGFPMRRVNEVLELTGLAQAANKKVGAYSLGMRQRLSLAGALHAGIGSLVRNVGGAVTGAVLVLFIVPPILIQLAQDTASWVPGALSLSVSGITTEPAVLGAAITVTLRAAVPALLGLVAVQRRDVV